MGDPLSNNHDSSEFVSHRCREFESALREGSRPTIEGYLVDTEGQDRQQLVAALVAVEIRFRQQCGEKPRLPEYIERFPDYTAILNEIVPPSWRSRVRNCSRRLSLNRPEQRLM